MAIDPPAEAQPPPLSLVDFSYPTGLGFATSGLGVASCSVSRLELEGAIACPADSRLGSGNAIAEVAFGPTVVQEYVYLGLFAGPSPDGYLHMLILATAKEPIQARIVMTGVLLPGHLRISVPTVPGLPGGPDVSIAQIHATIGGHLTYYEHIKGKLLAYHPPGIGLPDSCPRGGWRLETTLMFLEGTQSIAHTTVRCPRTRR